MESDFSREALKKFFEYLGSKGLMNSSTVAARKSAANKMLSLLDDKEARDLRHVDLDLLSTRFSHLHGKDFTPDSMTTYKSRLKSGVEDFLRYTANPASFNSDAPRARAQSRSDNEVKSGNGSNGGMQPLTSDRVSLGSSETVFPIPLRQGLVVKVVGIPADMSKKEAQKIANVVLALATIEDD